MTKVPNWALSVIRCRSRSSTIASRSRSKSRERDGKDEDDEEEEKNKRKRTPPPKPSRSINNQQDCGHHSGGRVVNIPIHTPDGLKSALKKPESKVVNVPIHTSSGTSRSRENCGPINVPIHTSASPQRERSTIRPWLKSNKEEPTVKTCLDYAAQEKKTGEELISLPIKMPDCHNCATKKTNHPHEGPDPACITSNLESITEEVKNKLRDLGKHGRFQIESVKDTSQEFKSTIQRSGRWERTVSKTSTFQLFP